MYQSLFFLFGITLLLSCKDNTKDVLEKGLIGKWSVVHSELNNKPSKTMENAFFSFDETKKVVSNVFEEKDVTYVIDDRKITIQTNTPLELDISYFENDSMILEGNYSLYYVKFFMKKDTIGNNINGGILSN
ncbi:MAG: hypothetical protein IPN79_18105 [Saprospiraceae bacterium]|nr:hypothetical protein [Saprospiraceae bacterium]